MAQISNRQGGHIKVQQSQHTTQRIDHHQDEDEKIYQTQQIKFLGYINKNQISPNQQTNGKKNQLQKSVQKIRKQIVAILILILLIFWLIFEINKKINNFIQHPKSLQDKIKQQNQHLVPKRNQFDLKNNNQENSNKSQFQLNIPKQLFLFEASKNNLIIQKYIYTHMEKVAIQSGFQISKILNSQAQPKISQKSRNLLSELLKKIKQNTKMQKFDQLPPHYSKAFYYLIQLLNLNDNGGIMISAYFCLTQDFSWIKNITNHIHVRRGLDPVDPQVFAFYTIQHSSELKHVNIRTKYDIEKRVRLFPSLMPSIIVAEKESAFIKDVVDEIIVLLSAKDIQQALKGPFNYYGLDKTNIYQDLFSIAAHRVLQRKQTQLDNLFVAQNKTSMAVDFYGLFYLNANSGPKKLQKIFASDRANIYFQYLARMDRKELEGYLGKFKIAAQLFPIWSIGDFMTDYMKQNAPLKIVKGSFIQQMLFPSGKQEFLVENKEYRLAPQNKTWSTLPRIIWIFWDKGIHKAPVNNQFCVENIKRVAKQSGFEVRIVDEVNIKQYLNQQTLKQIYSIKAKATVETFPQTIADLIRIALLRDHGGVYMDSSVIALQSFDWLINISNFPSQFIFNRYGDLPKVLMQYHPLYGGNLTWTYNQKHNTKEQWQLSYENNFIAAEKGADLIKEWFAVYKKALQLPSYADVKIMYQNCKMNRMSWGMPYLIAMDTIKCTINLKDQYLSSKKQTSFENALDYYRIWTINGYRGFQKNRENFGMDNPKGGINTLLYEYSLQYYKQYLGSMFEVSKIYGWFNRPLSNIQLDQYYYNKSGLIHPESFLAKYLTFDQMKITQSQKDQFHVNPK